MHKILIVDDNELFRFSIKSLVSSIDNITFFSASNSNEARNIIFDNNIDLVLLDLKLGNESGIEFAKYLNSNYPEIKILYLTIFDIQDKLTDILDTTYSGITYKDVSVELILNVIKLILSGGTYVDSSIYKEIQLITERKYALNNEPIKQKKYFDDERNVFLTKREIDISLKIAEGKSTQQIGDELELSKRTVDTHKQNVFNKLGFNKSTQLTQYVITKVIPFLNE
jgi:DNA-binding NarL/FixJ family response regulator